MANEADDAQDYIERAYAEYFKRPRVPERPLPTGECDLCGEVTRVINNVCISCRDRYRL